MKMSSGRLFQKIPFTCCDVDRELLGVVCNIFMAFIGSGVLGLPYAFRVAGVAEGVMVMSVVSFLSIKAMLRLVECKYEVLRRRKSADRYHKREQNHFIRPNQTFNDEHNLVDHQNENNSNVKNGKFYEPPLNHTFESNKRNHNSRCISIDEIELVDQSKSTSKKDFDLLYASNEHVSYSEVAGVALGWFGHVIVDLTIIISQMGFCCAYLIFVTQNLHSILLEYENLPSTDTKLILFIILIPLFFLSLIPDLRKLTIFSFVSQTSNFFAFAVVFYFDFKQISDLRRQSPGEIAHRTEFSAQGFPFFFSVSMYCFEGAGLVLNIEEAAIPRLRAKFATILSVTLTCLAFLFLMFGISGYLSYGEETRDIITLNLPHGGGKNSSIFTNFSLIVKFCLSVSMYLCYPMMLFPVIGIVEKRLFVDSRISAADLTKKGLDEDTIVRYSKVHSDDDESDSETERSSNGSPLLPPPLEMKNGVNRHSSSVKGSRETTLKVLKSSTSQYMISMFHTVAIRFALVTLTAFIVVLVPNFGDIISLIGATCCTLIAFILPAMCHLSLFNVDDQWREDEQRKSTSDHDHARYHAVSNSETMDAENSELLTERTTKISERFDSKHFSSSKSFNFSKLTDYTILFVGLVGAMFGSYDAIHNILSRVP